MRIKVLLVLFLGLSIGVITTCLMILVRREIINSRVKNWYPIDMSVKLDSTNLPIVLINSKIDGGGDFERDNFIKSHLTIINNENGCLNYVDTVKHPNQSIDYEGDILIKYRGHSSYLECKKKSFTIRTLNSKGEKKKRSLLGMQKDKKWALRAVQKDKTLMHDILVSELSRPYVDWVPEMKYCEVMINGIYAGVYLLSEQITPNRLSLSEPGNKGDSLTGGYLFQVDRPSEN